MKKEIKVTYRGWPGHYCEGHRCVFHLNTLIEYGKRRYVVSTVGNLLRDGKRARIGLDRYYETYIFMAYWDRFYWEADVTKQVRYAGPWAVENLDDDLVAQANHEKAVAWVVAKLERGEKLR